MNHEHRMSYGPLLVNNMNSEIEFQNVTKLNNLSVNEYIFQHRGVIYKNILGTFKEYPVYNVPSRLYRVSGTPRVHFLKQHGRLQPELDIDDSIRVSLLPTEVVEAGQLLRRKLSAR